MLTTRVKNLYHRMLTSPADSPTAVRLLCQVLTNIHSYLVDEELKMMKAEAECNHVLHFFLLFLCFRYAIRILLARFWIRLLASDKWLKESNVLSFRVTLLFLFR